MKCENFRGSYGWKDIAFAAGVALTVFCIRWRQKKIKAQEQEKEEIK